MALGCKTTRGLSMSSEPKKEKKCCFTFTDSLQEEVGRPGTECLTAIHESVPQLRKHFDAVFQSLEKLDPQEEHVGRVPGGTTVEMCQVHRL